MGIFCPNCEALLGAPLLPDRALLCDSCRATLLLRDDGGLEVTPATGESYEVLSEDLFDDTVEAEPN